MGVIFNLADFLLFVFSTTFTPGPNNLTGMALASTYNIKATIKFGIGVSIAFLVMIVACGIFSSAIYAALPVAKYVLASLGALYMLYLAYKTLFSGKHTEKKQSKLSGIPHGIFQTFVNPKAIFYALTLSATYISPHFKSIGAYLLFGVGLGILSAFSVTIWGLFGAAIMKFFSKYSLVVNIVMALLLVYCAYSVFMGMFHIPAQ